MGIAMGCVGMSMKDFERCTPSEFREVFDAWKQQHDQRERREWECARMTWYWAVYPYSKKGIKLTDLAKFPWDKEQEKTQPKKQETMEEIKANFEKAKKRLGLK